MVFERRIEGREMLDKGEARIIEIMKSGEKDITEEIAE